MLKNFSFHALVFFIFTFFPHFQNTLAHTHQCLHTQTHTVHNLLPIRTRLPSFQSVQFSSVAQLCLTLCDPMNRSTPGLPVHHQLPEFTQTHVHRVVMMPSSHLILCRPFLLLPPISPSIKVFSNESTLCIRSPKYWSFSFSIIPFKEYPGLILEWTGWISLQPKGLSRVFSNTTVQKHQFFGAQLSL